MKTKFFLIIICFICHIGFTQTFQDNLANEQSGDFPSQWDVVAGMANVDKIQGTNVISIMHGGIIKPMINGQNNNYISGDFTLEFDAYFDRASSVYGQRFEVRLWNGNSSYIKDDIKYNPFIFTRHGIKTSWRSPEPGSSTTNLKELNTLEPVWRHIKFECTDGKLKVYLDDKMILNFPRFKMQPTMVSIGAGINESKFSDTKLSITNITIVNHNGVQIGETEKNEPNGTKIIIITDKTTKKVQNIELYETMQDPILVTEKYPNSTFHQGKLYGNYSLVPNSDAVLAVNTEKNFSPGDQFNPKEQYTKTYEFLPLKGARSFTSGNQFTSGDQILPGQQFTSGNTFSFGSINTKILENNNGVVFFKEDPSNASSNYNLTTLPERTTTINTDRLPDPIEGTTDDTIVFDPTKNHDDEIKDTTILIPEPFEPIDATTTPQFIPLEIKLPSRLKITITDLLCIEERDSGDNPDDYALQLFSYFKDSKADYDRFFHYDNNIDCNRVVPGGDLLVCGDIDHQIHVEKGNARVGNFTNASLYYGIDNGHYTMDEVEDIKLFLWLKEYTGNKDKVLFNGSIEIKITEILNHLLNKEFPNNSNLVQYYDTSITTLNDFYEYGPRGSVMWLRFTSRKTLEGPIRLGNSHGKAAVWVELELMD